MKMGIPINIHVSRDDEDEDCIILEINIGHGKMAGESLIKEQILERFFEHNDMLLELDPASCVSRDVVGTDMTKLKIGSAVHEFSAYKIASVGDAVDNGNVLSSSIHSVARKLSLAKQSLGYAIFSFALIEAIASFSPMMTFLISFVFRKKRLKFHISKKEELAIPQKCRLKVHLSLGLNNKSSSSIDIEMEFGPLGALVSRKPPSLSLLGLAPELYCHENSEYGCFVVLNYVDLKPRLLIVPLPDHLYECLLKLPRPRCLVSILMVVFSSRAVEPAVGVDLEGLEVVRECLAEVFKINTSSIDDRTQPGLLVNLFSSVEANKEHEIKSDLSNVSVSVGAPSTSLAQNAGDSNLLDASTLLGERCWLLFSIPPLPEWSTPSLGWYESSLLEYRFSVLILEMNISPLPSELCLLLIVRIPKDPATNPRDGMCTM
ncbi:hypothetical protein HHK36_007795 [Tetracentron sinense]|uniref:Uncharacterized protein n=1 Tax=Tetracentron sinense TaxID=13715 RepID=A0A835DJA8_TETSI|nr:hypothetical protein HHK36_007795 [Tetracentron sinense]